MRKEKKLTTGVLCFEENGKIGVHSPYWKEQKLTTIQKIKRWINENLK